MKTFILLAACVLFISSGNAQDREYSFKESYAVSPPAQLAISAADGNIDVVASSGNEIQVLYVVKKYNQLLKISREELEKDVKLEVLKTGNNLMINARNREDFKMLNFKDQIRVSFILYVPKEITCDLVTSDGNISLEGVTSSQHCKTGDGNIRASQIIGNFSGQTSDGNISIEEIIGSVEVSTSDGNIHLNRVTGDVQANTGDGNIELQQIKGKTSLKTSDGHISFKELSGSLSAHTSDGSIRGNIVALKEKLVMGTGDGSIDVTIPANLGLDLDIKGNSLHVPLNNFSGKSDERSIQGKSNGGGIAVTLSTSDGNITVNYL